MKMLNRMFPQKNCLVRTDYKMLLHFRQSNGSINIKQRRGDRTTTTEKNIERIVGIITNLRPGKITSSRKISKSTGIEKTSVKRMKKDIGLKH